MSTVFKELLVHHLRVFDKHCSGCQRHQLPIMLTLQGTGGGGVPHTMDLFFTKEQAQQLVQDIYKALEDNEWEE